MKATDFIFDGTSLSHYGFIICEFDGGSGTNVFEAGVPIQFRTVPRRKGRRYSLVDLRYDNALEISFDICKDPCDNAYTEDMIISDEEFLNLSRWLIRKEYKTLQFVDDTLHIPRFYRGIFNISKLTIGDDLFGLRLVMLTDKPYAYGITTTHAFNINDISQTYTLSDGSVLTGIITPNLKVICREAGNLVLKNNLTGTSFEIKNCVNNEIITVDGDALTITSSVANHNLMDDFNFTFFKVGNTIETRSNAITSSMKCKLEITYAPIIQDAP